MSITMMIPRLVDESDEDAASGSDQPPDGVGRAGANTAAEGQDGVEEEGSDSSDGRRVRRRGRVQVPTLEEETESDDSEFDDAPGMPEILRQMAAMQRRFLAITRQERRSDQPGGGPQEERDEGIGDDLEEGEAIGAVAAAGSFNRNHNRSIEDEDEEDHPHADLLLNKSPENSSTVCKAGSSTSTSTSSDEMEVDSVPASGNSVSSVAIPIVSSNGRNRCSSSTSVSTSATSGIGTCSSVEEPTEMDFIKELEDEDEEGTITGNGAFSSPEERGINNLTKLPPSTGGLVNLTSPTATPSSPEDPDLPCHVADYDDEDADSTECYSNCLPSSSKEKHHGSDPHHHQDSKQAFLEPQPGYRRLMTERIDQLPVPLALKQFLRFYRT